MINLRGLSVADLPKFSYGMLLNYCYAWDRQQAKIHGKKVADPEEQYGKLKKIEPIVDAQYRNGKIEEKRYLQFKEKLRAWESED